MDTDVRSCLDFDALNCGQAVGAGRNNSESFESRALGPILLSQKLDFGRQIDNRRRSDTPASAMPGECRQLGVAERFVDGGLEKEIALRFPSKHNLGVFHDPSQ